MVEALLFCKYNVGRGTFMFSFCLVVGRIRRLVPVHCWLSQSQCAGTGVLWFLCVCISSRFRDYDGLDVMKYGRKLGGDSIRLKALWSEVYRPGKLKFIGATQGRYKQKDWKFHKQINHILCVSLPWASLIGSCSKRHQFR